MEKYVLAIGELLIDGITALPVNDLSGASVLNLHEGGSTANFCRYLKRCGTASHIVSSVGRDGFGKILLNKMTDEGIDSSHIAQQENRNTSFIAVARTSGTPDFIAYRDADIYIPPIAPALIAQASLVHTTAFALSKEPARSNIMDALLHAHSKGIPVSVDWNYAPEIWGSDNDAAKVFQQLQELDAYFKFSLDDVERFMGREATKEDAMAFLDNISSLATCLTCGKDGVYYKAKGHNWSFVGAQAIIVKNATGAGDAFWAGFISAVSAGLDVAASINRGIWVASLKLQDRWGELELLQTTKHI